MVPRPFCVCSTVFYVCLPRHFYRSRLALFWFAACFVLFLHAFSAMYVIFLWFGFSFLHVIPVAATSCHSLFLFIVLLYISFHTYPFTQKNLGLCGPDNVDWIKRVLGPICLCLSSHSTRELYYAVNLYSAADLYSTADLCFAIDLCTKGFEKGFRPNLSSSAKAILPGNCIRRQICILLQICVLL